MAKDYDIAKKSVQDEILEKIGQNDEVYPMLLEGIKTIGTTQTEIFNVTGSGYLFAVGVNLYSNFSGGSRVIIEIDGEVVWNVYLQTNNTNANGANSTVIIGDIHHLHFGEETVRLLPFYSKDVSIYSKAITLSPLNGGYHVPVLGLSSEEQLVTGQAYPGAVCYLDKPMRFNQSLVIKARAGLDNPANNVALIGYCLDE